MCIELVVTRDGFPLGYEVFEGNTGDTTTLEHASPSGSCAQLPRPCSDNLK